jgi:hypothetical protein
VAWLPEQPAQCAEAATCGEEKARSEKLRLAVLAAPDHLQAAKDALAKNYDAKTKLGGDPRGLPTSPPRRASARPA